ILMRRPLLIERAVVIRCALELPVVEPELFGRSPRRLGVEHPIMRYQAFEAVSVAEDPVDHVSAVARSQRALAVLVNEWIMLLGVVETLHQVFVRPPAP